METEKMKSQDDSMVKLRARFVAMKNRWKIQHLASHYTDWEDFSEVTFRTKKDCDKRIRLICDTYPVFEPAT